MRARSGEVAAQHPDNRGRHPFPTSALTVVPPHEAAATHGWEAEGAGMVRSRVGRIALQSAAILTLIIAATLLLGN